MIRAFKPSDLRALYNICLRTGDHGTDATPRCSHPELLGDYYAAPYAVREPGLCLILEQDSVPVGYILGTADTRRFVAWFNASWLPALRAKYQGVVARFDGCDTWLLELIARDVPAPAWVDDHPAHLHIDLLPEAQGKGWGRKLFHTWLDLARTQGATGMHLGVSKANPGAIGFYEHLGLKRLADAGGAWIYGMHWPERS